MLGSRTPLVPPGLAKLEDRVGRARGGRSARHVIVTLNPRDRAGLTAARRARERRRAREGSPGRRRPIAAERAGRIVGAGRTRHIRAGPGCGRSSGTMRVPARRRCAPTTTAASTRRCHRFAPNGSGEPPAPALSDASRVVHRGAAIRVRFGCPGVRCRDGSRGAPGRRRRGGPPEQRAVRRACTSPGRTRSRSPVVHCTHCPSLGSRLRSRPHGRRWPMASCRCSLHAAQRVAPGRLAHRASRRCSRWLAMRPRTCSWKTRPSTTGVRAVQPTSSELGARPRRRPKWTVREPLFSGRAGVAAAAIAVGEGLRPHWWRAPRSQDRASPPAALRVARSTPRC